MHNYEYRTFPISEHFAGLTMPAHTEQSMLPLPFTVSCALSKNVVYRRVLSISSLWAFAACDWSGAPVLSVLLSAAGLASFACWWDRRSESALHVADKACAWLVFVYLAWTTCDVRWPAAVAVLYYMSGHLGEEDSLVSNVAHLAFRFVFFWWAFLAARGPRAADALFWRLSLLYWTTTFVPALYLA